MSEYTDLRKHLARLPDFVFEFIDTYSDESVKTQNGYCTDIKIFLEYLRRFKFRSIESLEEFTERDMEKVTLRDLNGFKSYLREYESEYTDFNGNTVTRLRRNTPYGINRKLSAVRGLFSFLYKNDMISQNITDKVDFTKIHQKIKKPLTTQETVSLLDVIYNGERYYKGRDLTEYQKRKQRDIALFTAYLGTGCRVSELINLDVKDVCFDTSSFIVTRKGGDEQEIFMSATVQDEMYAYMRERTEKDDSKEGPLFLSRLGKRMTVQGVEKTLKKYCATVGIFDSDKARPHALRRTFACTMIAEGVDIKMVAELMGHKNIEVTHKYYAQYAGEKRKEVIQNNDIVNMRLNS